MMRNTKNTAVSKINKVGTANANRKTAYLRRLIPPNIYGQINLNMPPR